MATTTGRNDPCPCGSGQKYKHCCQDKTSWAENRLVTGAGIAALIVISLILIGLAVSNFSSEAPPECPQGQVWSEAHGHCH
jgi:hypothetical protein